MRFCIIGGTGRMGNFFATMLANDGHDVKIIGRKNWNDIPKAVKNSDIVIVSIPVEAVPNAVAAIKPHLTLAKLVLDFSSTMQHKEIYEGLPSGSAYLHPLFAPTIRDLQKVRCVLVPVKKHKLMQKIKSYLEGKGAIVIDSTLKKHEHMMAYVQALSHFQSIAFAKTLADAKLPAKDIEDYATVYFRLLLDTVSRIFNQTADTYSGIQFHNKEFTEVLSKHEQNIAALAAAVRSKDHNKFNSIFSHIQQALAPLLEKGAEESRQLVEALRQPRTTMAVLGPPGSFSDAAAEKAGVTCKKAYCNTIDDVIVAVKTGSADIGIVPLENSIGGTVAEAVDGIYNQQLCIKQALLMPISHCTAALSSGVKPDALLSHPQALRQCSEHIRKKYPGIRIIETASTSDAFRKIAEEKLTKAVAIGPRFAAEKYGLAVIDDRIENNKNNKTRFAIISKEHAINVKCDTTTVVVEPHMDRPGLLFDILKHFRKNKLNLCSMNSRPSKQELGVYVFHIDIEGNAYDKNVQAALKAIAKTNNVTLLGSYRTMKI